MFSRQLISSMKGLMFSILTLLSIIIKNLANVIKGKKALVKRLKSFNVFDLHLFLLFIFVRLLIWFQKGTLFISIFFYSIIFCKRKNQSIAAAREKSCSNKHLHHTHNSILHVCAEQTLLYYMYSSYNHIYKLTTTMISNFRNKYLTCFNKFIFVAVNISMQSVL